MGQQIASLYARIGADISGLTKGLASARSKLTSAGTTMMGIGAKLTAGVTVPILGIGFAAVKSAIKVESAFAGVIKTTEGLTDEYGNLNDAGKELKRGFQDLALEIPVDVEELMGIGELGGQLGITRDNLLDFTKTMAAMGVATNLSGEEAATAFAQIANIMGTAQDKIENMGSSVVDLGNNFATTEKDIVNFASRIAGAGSIVGLTEADVFGIATAFSSVGINAEAGGTSVQKVLLAMNKSVTLGGDQLDIFAKTAGMSSENFAKLWEKDAGKAFANFVTGLGDAGDDAMGILDDLEFGDQRLIRSFLSLAGAGDLINETMDRSATAWEENTALSKEAAQRYATTESKLILMKNAIKDVAVSFGDLLLPFLHQFLDVIRPTIDFVKNMTDGQKMLALKIAGVLAVAGPLVTVIGLVMTVVGALLSPVGLVIAALVLLGVAFVKASGGIGPAIENIKDLANTLMVKLEPVLSYIRETWDELWPHMQEIITTALNKIKALWARIWPYLQTILAGTWQEIKIVIETGAKVMKGLLKVGMALIRGDWEEAWEEIKTVLVAIWDGLKSIIKTRIDTIRGVLGSNLEKIESKWSGVWDRVKALVEDVLGKVVPFVKGMLSSMRSFFTEQMSIIKAWVDENMPLIQETFETILTAIKTAWDWVWDRVLEKIITVLGEIQTLWEWVWPYLETYVLGVWDGIKIIIDTAINVVLGIIKAVMLLINGDWEEAWEEIKTVANTLWTGIWTLIGSWLGTILELLGTSMGEIATVWETVWGNIKTFVETTWTNITTWIGTAIQNIITLATTTAQAVWDAITKPFQDVWNFLFDTTDGIFPDLLAKIGGWKDAVITLFQNAKDLIKNTIAAPFEAAKTVISGIFDTIRGWWNKIQFWKSNAGTGGGGDSEPAGGSGTDATPAPAPKTHWDDAGNYIGWWAKGLDGIFNKPTILGVGEAGPERVTVTPLRGSRAGAAAGGGTQITNNYNLQAVYPRYQNEMTLTQYVQALRLAG